MNKIREIRTQKRITMTALAKAAGISAPYLHDIEVGNRNGSPDTMDRIAEALGVEPEDLSERTETA